MNPSKTLLLLLASLLLTTCEKPSHDNPWDELAGLDPQSWAPKNLRIESPTITQRIISWEFTGDDRIEGFKIDRKRGNENWVESYAKLGKDSRSFSDTISPDQSTTYYYKVYAHAGNIKSYVMETTALAVFPVPNNFQIIRNSVTSATLSWQYSTSGIQGFHIYRKIPSSNWTLLSDQATTTYIDNDLSLNSIITYKIVAYYETYQSDEVEKDFNAQIPAPEDLTYTINSPTSITLNWVYPTTGHEGFQLERKTNQEAWIVIAPNINPEALNYTDDQILNQNDYSYRLRAYANSLFSDYISTVTFYNQTVTNPATGKTWMDRNLGASRVAQSSTDAEAYGDLYQWGRGTDGHEKRSPFSTTSTLSNSDTPGHGNFILSPNSPYDWRNPQNDNLWQGVNGTNNPCPPGFRLPTEAEWEAERQSWSSNNAAGAFNSPLKLPVAGDRTNGGGSLNGVGSYGFYWSATVDGTSVRYLHFHSSNASMSSNGRAYGNSVRCLKD